MEERFDKMICPNCGREMAKGISYGAQRPSLMWYPGRNTPSIWGTMKMATAEKTEDFSKGIYFDSAWDWWEASYRPSWYCHECGLLLIDTKTRLAKE